MATNIKVQARTETSRKRQFLDRLKEMADIKLPTEYVWEEISDYVIPRLWDILNDNVVSPSSLADRHKKYGENSFDGSPQGMLQLLADGLHGYLVSPSIRWFKLQMTQIIVDVGMSRVLSNYAQQGLQVGDIPEVKAWLEVCEEVMYSTYKNSNFYDAMGEYFLHGGSIGTATMWVEEDLDKQAPVYTVLHPKEIFIADNKYGQVDTLYRRMRMTARQIAQRCYIKEVDGDFRHPLQWDVTKLTDDVANAINNNKSDTEFNVLHAIQPRSDRNIRMPDGMNMPWSSTFILESGGDEEDTILNEWGFQRFQGACWRWGKDTGRLYGWSPAWNALVDIRKLNTMSKTLLTTAHKAADPSVQVPAEMADRVRLHAKGINLYTDEKRLIQEMPGASQYPIAIDREDKTREIIEEHFKVDFFLLLTRAERTMTATEVIERQGEKAAVLGTTIGRLNRDCLNPVTDLTFDQLMTSQKIPPPPQVLLDYIAMTGNGSIDIDYLGPLAQAQKKLFSYQGVMRGIESLIPIMEIEPTTKDVVDWDQTAKDVLEASGMPQRRILPDEAIAKIREARQQTMEREAMQRELSEGASTAKDFAAADQMSEGALSGAMQQMLPAPGETTQAQ